jgi:hypothetical protein
LINLAGFFTDTNPSLAPSNTYQIIVTLDGEIKSNQLALLVEHRLIDNPFDDKHIKRNVGYHELQP